MKNFFKYINCILHINKPLLKSCRNVILFSSIQFCSIFCLNAQSASVPAATSVTTESNTSTEESLAKKSTAEAVPLLLQGIWYNTNRYIVFETGYKDGSRDIPQVVLRTHYTWYNDRAAESKSYTEKTGTKTTNTSGEEKSDKMTIPQTARDRNNTTAETPEEIKITFVPLVQEAFPESYNMNVALSSNITMYAETEPSGAWDAQIQYPRSKIIYHVPLAVIGNELYLNFKVKNVVYGNSSMDTDSSSVFSSEMTGLWQDYGNASGILISPPVTNTELLSYFITSTAVYQIRYWQTDMDYDENAVATFSDGSNTYTVKKHLSVGGKIYTCVNGRGTKIRNIEKSNSMPVEYKTNSVIIQTSSTDENGAPVTSTIKESTICAIGKPYLTLSDGKKTIEQLVVEANNRRKPLPPPVFPPSGLDFHWDIIKELNKYNRVLSLGKE